MSTRLAALTNAQKHLGVAEQPPGSNRGPFIDRWLRTAGSSPGNPWCAAFLYSMFLDAGKRLPIRYPAAVYYWDKAGDEYGWKKTRPFRGDVICFSWSGPNPDPADHIGIVEKVLALPKSSRPIRFRGKYYVRTVEGNSSDSVQRRWRWVDPKTIAFLRIPE